MGSDFPRRPKVERGGIVAYQLPELLPTIIVFQYNPDEVSRSLQMQSAPAPAAAAATPIGSTVRRTRR